MDPATPEMFRRPPQPALDGAVLGLTGYRERGGGPLDQREAATLTVPLILSLGTPFEIALDRAPGPGDRQPSFMAGLHPGAVHIRSDGAAACVQLDLTPLGAHRLLGGALAELGSRMVEVGALFGPAGERLRERLAETPGWPARFALVEAFVAARLTHAPAPALAFAWRRLAETGGRLPIAALAAEAGWSRQHLAARFQRAFGLGPKQAARLLRFRRARAWHSDPVPAAGPMSRPPAASATRRTSRANSWPSPASRRPPGRGAPARAPASRATRRCADKTTSARRAGLRSLRDARREPAMQPPSLFPTLRCRDAAAMIAWLTGTLGFRVHARHEAGGVIAHAELAHGSSILMLGQAREDAYGALVGAPEGRRTDALYLAVPDADAAHARLVAAGAPITMALRDTDYGSREFACRDPEGNLWSIGTYWPRADAGSEAV